MSKLVWDATGERFYEMGVSKGVLYVQNASGSYKNGVAWNGLTAVTESPEGAEANDLYADNIKYASLRSAETFGGTIEAFTYPDEWMECDGFATPVLGVMVGQQARTPFGLCYRTEVGNDTATANDDGYQLHLVWNATASPSERGYETINDSPDAITFSWEFDTTPVVVSGYKPTAHITIDSTRLDAAGKTALAALEEMLYGTAGTDPSLPTPAEVISMMGGNGNLSVYPTTVSLVKNTYSSDIKIGNATQDVTVTVTDSDSQTYTKVQGIVSGDFDTLILHADSDADAGNYTVTLTSGTKSATIALTVTAS